MIILTWNLAGRTNKVKSQLEAISKHNADILAFQEVTMNSRKNLREELERMGYKYIKDSFDLSNERHLLTGKRKYGQMIASKYKFVCRDPAKFDVPWKERILSVDVITEFGKIELHTTHIPPGSSNGWIKIEMLEGIFKTLERKTKKHRILCGDFNTPKSEQKDGTIVTWALKGTEWDKGERQVLQTLADKDLRDVYRKLNGYDKQEYSWYVNHGIKIGRRFDHIFASDGLNAVKCFYDHKVREKGLSDHSAMVASFKLDARG